MDLTTDQQNELIAVFDGWECINPGCEFRIYRKDGYTQPIGRFNYHSNWSELMPIFEKIEQTESGRFGWCIDPFDIVITDYCNNEKDVVNIVRDRPDSKLICDCYEAVISFIQWYKNNKLSV